MNEILEMVTNALTRVYEEQFYLIVNRVSERSIVFWFGVYFYDLLQGTEFENLNLDVEYNRNLLGVKRTRHFRRGTYPDLILHERGSNESNILIVEFKPWWDTDIDEDIVKLQDFTNPDGEYKYDIGLSILLGQESPTCIIVKNSEVTGEF